MSCLKVLIIGHGFVGKAVDNAFNKNVDKVIIDPKYQEDSFTFHNINFYKPDIAFVCVPTPALPNGDVDVSAVRDVLKQLEQTDNTFPVVLKSTITPGHLEQFVNHYPNVRIVYNPEFLTEANSLEDFINPSMQILGGNREDCNFVEYCYEKHSQVKVSPVYKTDIVTASLIKYAINTWLATKVVFMNQLHTLHGSSGAETSWDEFVSMLATDKRVGNSHLQVPGPDGTFGFGGKCFPKDSEGFLSYAKQLGIDLSVLEEAVKANKKIRNG